MPAAQRFKAEILRHHPKMPRYILVPAKIVAVFGMSGTFVVSVQFGGLPAERKSIKAWGDGKRWFMDMPEPICKKLGVDTGATIAVEIEPVHETMPPALANALKDDADAARGWKALTAAQQRMTAENIYAAKRPETAAKRVADVLMMLKRMPAKKKA